MDHQVAVREQAATRYVLGELSAAERDQFEEHAFDCPTCARELRDTFAFAANLKDVLAEEPLAEPAPWWRRAADYARGPAAFPLAVTAALALIVARGHVIKPDIPAAVAELVAVPPASRGVAVLVRTPRGATEHHLLLDPPGESTRLRCSISALNSLGVPAGSESEIGVLDSKAPASQILVRLPVKGYPGGNYRVYLRGERSAEYDIQIVPQQP